MPLTRVKKRPFREGLIRKLFFEEKICAVCQEPNPNLEIVASFVGMFTGVHGDDEKHYVHEACVKNALRNEAFGVIPPQNLKRVLAHYEMASVD